MTRHHRSLRTIVGTLVSVASEKGSVQHCHFDELYVGLSVHSCLCF